MGGCAAHPLVRESLWMFLDPSEELVQLLNVLKLWLGCVSL